MSLLFATLQANLTMYLIKKTLEKKVEKKELKLPVLY